MANESTLGKAWKAFNLTLDSYIEKAQSNTPDSNGGAWDRKGFIEVDYGSEQQQYGWRERRGLLGPEVMKNMARKDSIIIAIIQTRLAQLSMFTKPQKTKYDPGFVIRRKAPLEMSREDKAKIMDPALEQSEREKIKYEAYKRLLKEQQEDEENCKSITEFILHCGMPSDEVDTTRKRVAFHKFCRLIAEDRLTYHYGAFERVFTKDGSKLHHWYPVSSGTVRYASQRSKEMLRDRLLKEFQSRAKEAEINGEQEEAEMLRRKYENVGDYIYLQIIRGRVVAAWTEKEFVFEAAQPTVDPEDMGYSPGELEKLINLITAHLYAEAYNRNYFSQGIGSKGILHIKGDNISRAQLEGFKRQWFSQIQNTRNAFRPPIIGMADDVRWVQLSQSNKDMEYDNWIKYLIRLICAVYQIDPAEINFDISKVNSSTLNESSNEHRIKSSRDKGLKPLLDYLEYLVNTEILPYWDKDLADKYEFAFVGLDAETRQQEADRITKEVNTYKTFNEARIEMNLEPIEGGDIIGNAQYAQAQMVAMQNKQAEGQVDPEEIKAKEDQQKKLGKERMKSLKDDAKELEKEMMKRFKAPAMDGEETKVNTGKQQDEKIKNPPADEPNEVGGVGVGPKGGEYITKPDGTKEYRKPSPKKDEETKKAFPVKVEYYQIQGDDNE